MTKSFRSESDAMTTIARHFPGSVAADAATLIDGDAVHDWCQQLYGHQRGFIWCCFGQGGRYAGGVYGYRRWEQHFTAWPAEVADLIALIRRQAAHHDTFVAPVLRTRRSGTAIHGGRANLIPTRWTWTDVDGDWTDQRDATWRNTGRTRATMLVNSGRGRHCYVRVGSPQSIAMTEALNRQLAKALDGEKWSASSLLRPPGTLNWKPYAAGGAPAPVRRIG
jgi:hypothetical protein